MSFIAKLFKKTEYAQLDSPKAVAKNPKDEVVADLIKNRESIMKQWKSVEVDYKLNGEKYTESEKQKYTDFKNNATGTLAKINAALKANGAKIPGQAS